MAESETRTEVIAVSVNSEEKALIFQEAKKKSLPASAWARSILLKVVREEIPQAKSA